MTDEIRAGDTTFTKASGMVHVVLEDRRILLALGDSTAPVWAALEALASDVASLRSTVEQQGAWLTAARRRQAETSRQLSECRMENQRLLAQAAREEGRGDG